MRNCSGTNSLTVIADYGDFCGEGPLWDGQSRRLYWTDVLRRRFYCYDWATRNSEIVQDGLEINSAAFNQAGGFVVCNSSGAWLWERGDPPRLVTDRADGSDCHLNDCIADPMGRLLVGSYFYDADKGYPLGKLIQINQGGSAQIIDDGFHLANGLGFSMDATTLYFSDSIARIIYAYDYEVSSGRARNRRIFVRIPHTHGIPDGLTVDAHGFVWSAEWYGSQVIRYDPDGRIERRVEIPAKQTSSLIFGGPDLTDIFITSAAKPDPTPVMPTGYNPNSGYLGGALYRINLGIQGKPEFIANIKAPSLTCP
jgi:sugar lactone lactonase YvrE